MARAELGCERGAKGDKKQRRPGFYAVAARNPSLRMFVGQKNCPSNNHLQLKTDVSEAHLQSAANRPAGAPLAVLVLARPEVTEDKLSDQPVTIHRLLPLDAHTILAHTDADPGFTIDQGLRRQQFVIAESLVHARTARPGKTVGFLGHGSGVQPAEG